MHVPLNGLHAKMLSVRYTSKIGNFEIDSLIIDD